MRLSKDRVRHMGQSVAKRLLQERHVELLGSQEAFVDALDRAIVDELSVEDRLNAEVRQMLKVYESQIDERQVDYHKMFRMVKQKLVRERGIIL